jgi:uncharacterized membrane-anchored protein
MIIKYIAALVLAAAAGSSFAASQAKTEQPQRAEETEVTVRTVDYSMAAFKGPSARTRAEVRAEAVEAAKNHQSSLAEQLELLK